MATDQVPAAYADLIGRSKELTHLRDAGHLLGWDQQVMMPPGGTPARAEQLATLSSVRHDRLTDPDLEAVIEDLESEDLDPERAAVLREIAREHRRERRVPSELVEQHAERASAAQETWQDARANADFAAFAPALEDLRELRVQRAEHIDPNGDPYETLYADQMPTLPYETIETILDELVEQLIPLIEEVRAAETAVPRPWADRSVPAEEQAALCEAAVEFLGQDEEHTRFDESTHPFTTGTQFDARITTRYDGSYPLDGVMATIHEYGHQHYILGLDREAYGTPLGKARSEVHESQSRFWENHVGRSRVFWEEFQPVVDEHFSDPTPGAETLFKRVNAVDPSNLIRVEADELTYHLHIAIRATVEQEYVSGGLSTEEIPERWNDLYEEYLGIRPEDDAEGCLQDIHWTHSFGGFQTYTVGSVLAAQLTEAMTEDLDLEGCISDRAFDQLHEWMHEHIHRHGQRYETPELIERATGQPLTAEPFVEHIERKVDQVYR